MKATMKVSIFSYLKRFILVHFFNAKSKLYYLLLCSSAPLLLGLPAVASTTVGQQIAQVVSAPGINRPTLKVGSQGEVVTELQAALKLLGYYNGAVDGKFSNSTAAAVTQFKQAAGLTADSVVDTATWQRLFPGEGNISSNTPLPSPTNSRFPVPTQTAADLPRPVVISNPASTEPRPSGRNNGNNQQLETVRTTSTTRTTSSSPVRNTTSTTATTRTSPTNRSGRTNNSSTSNTTTRTSSTNRSGRTNNSSASNTTTRTSSTNRSGRTNTSTSNTTNTTRPRPSIQYTSAGLPILRLGMRGEEVLELQEKLQRFGYLKSNPDGDFGAETEAAVKALQERYGMEADGVAGGATWDILNRRRNTRNRS